MTRTKKFIEASKAIVATICTFGVVPVPALALVLNAYHAYGTPWETAMILVFVAGFLPAVYFGLLFSYTLGRFFVNTWGRPYVEAV